MTTEVHGQADAAIGELSDAELIAAARDGDTEAYAGLYERHRQAAERLAETLLEDPAEAEDLVAEAFTRVFSALEDGRGPELGFRVYLHLTIRETFDELVGGTADEPSGTASTSARSTPDGRPVTARQDEPAHTLAVEAFDTLPERWQLILWHTEVEGDGLPEVAAMLGLTPEGVAASARRGAERLREAYLAAHISDAPPPESCVPVARLLAAEIAGDLSEEEHSQVLDHLSDCPACAALQGELADLDDDLAGLLAPTVLGPGWAAYLGAGITTVQSARDDAPDTVLLAGDEPTRALHGHDRPEMQNDLPTQTGHDEPEVQPVRAVHPVEPVEELDHRDHEDPEVVRGPSRATELLHHRNTFIAAGTAAGVIALLAAVFLVLGNLAPTGEPAQPPVAEHEPSSTSPTPTASPTASPSPSPSRSPSRRPQIQDPTDDATRERPRERPRDDDDDDDDGPLPKPPVNISPGASSPVLFAGPWVIILS